VLLSRIRRGVSSGPKPTQDSQGSKPRGTPNGNEEVKLSSPQKIMDEIAALDAESAEVLGNIKALL
jgi:hypothetical protein